MGWTHNPSVVGSSPTRPTHFPKTQIRACDLRKRQTVVIFDSARLCGYVRAKAARCRSLCRMRAEDHRGGAGPGKAQC